jgi:hypothetical protein
MGIESEKVPVRICPACREEFQPHVTECLDCGGPTVPGWEGVPVAAPSAARPELSRAPDSYASPEANEDFRGFDVLVRSGPEEWVSPLLERLRRAGIETRVGYSPQNQGSLTLGVLVRPEDEARAREVEIRTYVKQIPDLPGSLNRTTTDLCPACRGPVRPSDAECPDCGLALDVDDPACGCGDGGCATGPEAGLPALEGNILPAGRDRRG